MFWTFLGALLHQWISLAGGTIVSVALLIWQAAGNPNVPGWLFAVVAIGTFVGAAFQAWNAERVRADRVQDELNAMERARPSAVLRPMIDGQRLLVEVRNDGADGVFRATIETDGGGAGPLEPMPAIWDLTDSHEPVEIPHGTWARIRVGTIHEERRPFWTPDGEEISPDYGWQLSYHKPPGHRGWNEGRRDLDAADAEWFTVRIVVRSQPQLEGGAVSRRLRLIGHRAVDVESREQFTPRPIVVDEYYEEHY